MPRLLLPIQLTRGVKPRTRSSIRLVLVLFALAGLGSWVWFLPSWVVDGSIAAQAAVGHPQQAVPVLAAIATAEDFPIIVRGIGSVVAFNTVSVKSRVDGNIVKIAFTEGRPVNAGDLLVQIDPRPYQTQLAQSQANKARMRPILKMRDAISTAMRYC